MSLGPTGLLRECIKESSEVLKGGRADNFTAIFQPITTKFRYLNVPKTYGALLPVTGIFLYFLKEKAETQWYTTVCSRSLRDVRIKLEVYNIPYREYICESQFVTKTMANTSV